MDFCLSESDDGNPLNSMDAFDACSYNGNMRSTWNGPETLQAVLPLLLTSDVIIDIPSVQHEGGRGHFCISAPGKAEFRYEGREAHAGRELHWTRDTPDRLLEWIAPYGVDTLVDLELPNLPGDLTADK
jgi:hypothetical protein